MKLFYENIKSKNTVYFGAADSFVVTNERLRVDYLLTNLKYAVLLYDLIVFPAAFFWQSSSMQQVLARIEPLIQCGQIVPSIRNARTTNDIYTYFEMRLSETSSLVNDPVYKIKEISTEIARPVHKEIAKALDKNKTVYHQGSISVMANYKLKWKRDLRNEYDSDSLNRIIYQHLGNRDYQELLKKIEKISNSNKFSRSYIVSEILKLNISKPLQCEIIRKVTEIFLNASAESSNSELITTNNLVDRWAKDNTIKPSNIKLFAEALKYVGINQYHINELTSEEIMMMKLSPEFQSFKSKFLELVKCLGNEEDDLIKHLDALYFKERRNESLYQYRHAPVKLIKYVSGVWFSTYLGNLLTNPEYVVDLGKFITTGSVTSLVHLTERLGNADYQISKTGILDFEKYIVRKQYSTDLRRLLLNGRAV